MGKNTLVQQLLCFPGLLDVSFFLLLRNML